MAIKFSYKCKICLMEINQPTKQHIKEDYEKIAKEIDTSEVGRFFDIVFKPEWAD